MPADYYQTLGVKRDASDDEIKKTYRKLARQFHPDRNPGDKQAEARFKEIQEAYDILSDKAKRAQYDRFGHAGPGGFPGGGGGGTGPFTFRWGSGEPGGGFEGVDPDQVAEILRHFSGGGFGNIFEEAAPRSRRGRRTQQAPPRQDVETEVSIPFQTAALGGHVGLSVNGKELSVKIPAGVDDGQTLRLPGQAPAGGDLRLKLRVQPHAFFRREGKDLVLEAPLSVAEAVLGTRLDVPTLDGTKLTVKVPPGTSSGSRLRLKGRGVHGGDQYIEIKIVAPAPKDDRSRQLMEEFARLNPQHPRSGHPWE